MGNDNIKTFQRGTIFPGQASEIKHKLKIYLDDKLIVEKEI